MQQAVVVLQQAIAAGAIPGGVLCVLQNGVPRLHTAVGTTDGTTPTTTETRYDLASVTKPVATAATVLSLVEEGVLLLGASVGELLGTTSELWKDVTLRHLLTHTSGLPAWTACYSHGLGLERAVEAILALPKAAAETKYEYSCLGYILLAQIVEKMTGKTLAEVAEARVFGPLGLTTLTFDPDPGRCAPTIPREGLQSGETLRGIVHDGNARGIRAGSGSVSGNAGLFGTALDVARFGQAVLDGTLFGSPTRMRLLTPQSTPPGHTLGFFCLPNTFTPLGELLPDTTVGHSGFTGTFLTLVPEYNTVICLLTNAVYCNNEKADFLLYRRKVLNTVAAAL